VRTDSVNIFFYYGSTTPVGLGLLYEVTRSHSFRHIILGTTLRFLRTSDHLVAETSDNTQHSKDTDIHSSCGIRTRNPNKRSAPDPRLRLGSAC